MKSLSRLIKRTLATVRPSTPPPLAPPDNGLAKLTAEHAWYKWYFGEYAAALRRTQYGTPTMDIDPLIAGQGSEFTPIEQSLRSVVHPTESHGALTHEFIYFAARFLPLPGPGGTSGYAVSYLGSGEFAHSGKAFDALITPNQWKGHRTAIDKPYGLADKWIVENGWETLLFTPSGSLTHYRPMAYNTGDIDGDGSHDFIFGTWLILSSLGYQPAADVPRETIFVGNHLVSFESGHLTLRRWVEGRLDLVSKTGIPNTVAENLPHILLPMPGEHFALRTLRGLDVLRVDNDAIIPIGWIEGLSPGEVQTGAFGDFDGDGREEFWLSQVATPTRPETQDHVSLIAPERIQVGRNVLSDVAIFKIRGSRAYSDYDGVSSTLSPLAGDVDGCGRPDLTFTGHRHMNESGALYILRNRDIVVGQEIDLTAPQIVKILGRDMSQIAPPFQHWDASDVLGEGRHGIILPADNDLCAGINAGAIYVLSGKSIFPGA